MQEYPEMPSHMWELYITPYPSFGPAISYPAEVGATQGLEKGHDHRRRKKLAIMKKSNSGSEATAILGAAEQRVRKLAPEYRNFHVEPKPIVSFWDHIQIHANESPGTDFVVAIYFRLDNGKLLRREDAIGRASAIGGYVVYLISPQLDECLRRKAIETYSRSSSTGGRFLDQQIVADSMSNNRTATEQQPLAVRKIYASLLGKALQLNTPTPRDGENFRKYVERRGSRRLSVKDLEKQFAFRKRSTADDVDAEEMLKSEVDAYKEESDPEAMVVKDLNRVIGNDFTTTRSIAEEEEILRKASAIEENAGNGCEESTDDKPSGDKNILESAAEILFRRALKEHNETAAAARPSNETADREKHCRRPLGWFQEVIVSPDGSTTSACNEFARFGQSRLQIIYDVVERDAEPPHDLADTGKMPWDKAAQKWKEKLSIELFTKEEESDERDEMYNSLLPNTDPLFDHLMLVQGIIVPRLTIGENKFGLWFSTNNVGKMTITEVTNKCADLFVGDLLVSVNGARLADGMSPHDVASLFRNTPANQIVQVEVFRQYRRGSRLGGLYRDDVFGARSSKSTAEYAPAGTSPSPSPAPPAPDESKDGFCESNSTNGSAVTDPGQVEMVGEKSAASLETSHVGNIGPGGDEGNNGDHSEAGNRASSSEEPSETTGERCTKRPKNQQNPSNSANRR